MIKKSSAKFFLLFCSLAALVGTTQPLSAQNAASVQGNIPYRDFTAEHVWDAKVKIAAPTELPGGKHGTRRVIPITGGTFTGPKISGDVLPVGEDWQLTRLDGDTELHARYVLKTSDGYLIQVTNRALWHVPSGGENKTPYIKSVIDLEAPTNSPYDYLNHAIFIGTLELPKLSPGEAPYVIIGVYKLL